MKKPIEFIRGRNREKRKIDFKALFGDKKCVMAGVGCAAIIAAAVWANVALNGQLAPGSQEELTAVTEAENMNEAVFFDVEEEPQDSLAVFRAQKDAARAEELSYLEEIVADENSEGEAVSRAQSSRLSIIDAMEKEMVIEGLIMAKGLGNAAVTVSTGSVNVVIDNDALEADQVAQILDITVSETGASPENVKIMPVQ